MKQRPRYTDEFRAGAVVMLEAQGYPRVKGSLQSVSDHLHVPAMTLHRWFHAVQNPPPRKLVKQKTEDFRVLLRREIAAALQAAPEAREFATYKDLITGAAILLDKLQLLEGKPTDRSEQTIRVRWSNELDH